MMITEIEFQVNDDKKEHRNRETKYHRKQENQNVLKIYQYK